MNKPIVLLGSGGHAKVLIDCLKLNNIDIVGVTDKNPNLLGKQIYGINIIGNDSLLESYSNKKIHLVNGIGSTMTTDLRTMIFNKFKDKGFSFFTVIHPSTTVSSKVLLEEGCQIMAGSIIQPYVKIGSNVIINTMTTVDHDCNIGNNTHIAPGNVISGNVSIGSCVHVGCGSTILQGVTIGDNSLIGAGSLVNKDIPPNSKAFGNPAKVRENERLE